MPRGQKAPKAQKSSPKRAQLVSHMHKNSKHDFPSFCQHQFLPELVKRIFFSNRNLLFWSFLALPVASPTVGLCVWATESLADLYEGHYHRSPKAVTKTSTREVKSKRGLTLCGLKRFGLDNLRKRLSLSIHSWWGWKSFFHGCILQFFVFLIHNSFGVFRYVFVLHD